MDAMPEHAAVVVVDSDSVALAAGLGLAQQGVRCVLVSDSARAGSAEAIRRGNDTVRLSAHTVSLLSQLGVDTASFHDSAARTRTYLAGREIEVAPLPPSRRYANVPVGSLLAAMRDAVVATENCVLVGPARTGVTVDEGGVTVTVQPPSGGVVACRADFVVRTDRRPGGESGIEPGDEAAGGDALVVVDIEAAPAIGADRQRHLDPPWQPGGHVLIEATAPGRWRVEWPVSADAVVAATSAAAVDVQVRASIGQGVPYEVLAVRYCPAGWHLPQTYREGRVFFAGEATQTAAAPNAGARDDGVQDSGRLGAGQRVERTQDTAAPDTTAPDTAALDTAVLGAAVLGAADVNRGIEDADNLAWKLAYALRGDAGDELLQSYDVERRCAVETQVEELADALRSLSPTTRTARWRRHPLARGRRSARLRRIEQQWGCDAGTYTSAVLQPGAGALAPELPVRATDGWRGALSELRGGEITVVAIGPTETDAVALAVAVEAASVARAATTVGVSLPPHRFVGGAAANASAGIDAAGTALGNLLVVRPDGRVSWKVNGEDAPDEVAVALAAALSRTVGR